MTKKKNNKKKTTRRKKNNKKQKNSKQYEKEEQDEKEEEDDEKEEREAKEAQDEKEEKKEHGTRPFTSSDFSLLSGCSSQAMLLCRCTVSDWRFAIKSFNFAKAAWHLRLAPLIGSLDVPATARTESAAGTDIVACGGGFPPRGLLVE